MASAAMDPIGTIKYINSEFWKEYEKVPTKLKVIDSFLVYGILTAAVQFAYMTLFGTFPFNSFLAGFFCSIGFCVLTACLRLQMDPGNKDFQDLAPERALADYTIASLVLLLVVWSYMG